MHSERKLLLCVLVECGTVDREPLLWSRSVRGIRSGNTGSHWRPVCWIVQQGCPMDIALGLLSNSDGFELRP